MSAPTSTPNNEGGLLFEREFVGAATINKHYIIGGGGVVAVVRTGSVTSTEYWHKDALGSVVVRTDSNGVVIAGSRRAFDPWGKASPGADGYRGFTEHEQFDTLGFVHMNGRIYDPALGRFMSADPTIQYPHDLQNYNRYSYVNNNPLGYTDPSGYGFFSKLWRNIVRPAVAFVVGTVACGGNPYCGAALAGAVQGYSQTHNLRGAVIGTINGLISAEIGAQFPIETNGSINIGHILPNAALHAARACGVASAQGGRCGSSAAAAFVTSALGPLSDNALEGGGLLAQLAGRAVVGGIASKAAGGSFEDGLREGAFESITNALHIPIMVAIRLAISGITYSRTAIVATEIAGEGLVAAGGAVAVAKGGANALQEALSVAKPVGNRLETVLDDGSKVIFRDAHSHPLPPRHVDSVRHYNVELQVPVPGRPGRFESVPRGNLHIIVDQNGRVVEPLIK